MSDIDKYEGHTKGDDEVGWRINNNFVSNGKCPNDRYIAYVREGIAIPFSDADANLIADAPLILQALIDERAEVKRLRSIADDLYAYIVSDAGISLKIIEEQMDWRDEE